MGSSDPVPRIELSPGTDPARSHRLDVPSHLREGLTLLLQAHDYALDLGQDPWDLAVEIHVLRAVKLTNSDLRWLACKGYIELAVEIADRDDPTRRFHNTGPLSINDSTCAVLTPDGAAVARDACSAESVLALARPVEPVHLGPAAPDARAVPKWDHQRRQLRVGGRIVKEFKLPSPNQETVLVAFEEEGWPARIDDPLSPVSPLDPRRRLHDTIKALNRNQKAPLIRFMGDGSGEGIRWEVSQASGDGTSGPAALG
ncbi:MAG: hypothetical protein HYX69_07930 [Planctomycetia bacterium]|nr:hypothetical protein [Planctomycetia bacterium]